LVVTAMIRTRVAFTSVLSLLALACSQGERSPEPDVDCSVLESYEFSNISDFAGADSGWFRYADPTPGGVPNPEDVTQGSNVPVTQVEAPGRCGDTRFMKLEAKGHNFWGSGFGDWAHNDPASRANGTGYEGISFWARSPIYAEKQFMLNIDESRTIVLDVDDGPDGLPLPVEQTGGTDLDGDGFIGPGDIVLGSECLKPPPEELGEPNCYNGGVDSPPSGGVRVPEPNECGNSFHVRVTTTERWQLFVFAWDDLLQWPCPNRLKDGINEADIAKLEIRFEQGTHYELWLDNIAFYRRR
jgi:hypothetical protein